MQALNTNTNHRKELDGVRAIAIIFVLIYHAKIQYLGQPILQGGFFGVDVFFVLSGYLITKIITSQMKQQSFSFIDFYKRRAKRIIPAMLVMLTGSSFLAYLTLMPEDLISFTKSLISAASFTSNFFFLNEDSYTSSDSIFKPLLHTWSISIEWQFYLVFPLIIWLTNIFATKYLLQFLIAISLFSLTYCISTVAQQPDTTFYLLTSRAWELTTGGIASLYRTPKITKNIHKTLPYIGLILITYCAIFISHETQHPSFITLLPVIGTCLIIIFTKKDDAIYKALSVRPLVFIGTISYSLYLWHQPIFVFFRLSTDEHIGLLELTYLLAISTALSMASYKLIETTYRYKALSIGKLTLLIAIPLALYFFSLITLEKNGFPERLSKEAKLAHKIYSTAEFRRLEDHNNLGKSYRDETLRAKCNLRTVDTACSFGDESWVTVGDSFLGQYDFALSKRLSTLDKGMISLAYEQCPFVSPEIWFGTIPECSIVNEERLKKINAFQDTKNIIVAANYKQFFSPKRRVSHPIKAAKENNSKGKQAPPNSAWLSYAENIELLLEQGHEVYVIYSTPRPGINVKQEIFRQLKTPSSKPSPTYSSDLNLLETANRWSTILNSYLPNHPSLHKIYPTETLCKNGQCKIISKSGGLYNLGPHLSHIGANLILDQILKPN